MGNHINPSQKLSFPGQICKRFCISLLLTHSWGNGENQGKRVEFRLTLNTHSHTAPDSGWLDLLPASRRGEQAHSGSELCREEAERKSPAPFVTNKRFSDCLAHQA